jgi:hypothetical protein
VLSGRLPLTGLGLLGVVLLSIAGIGAGAALRRTGGPKGVLER